VGFREYRRDEMSCAGPVANDPSAPDPLLGQIVLWGGTSDAMKFRRAVAFHLEARRFVGIGSERHCGTNWTNWVRVVGSSRFVVNGPTG